MKQICSSFVGRDPFKTDSDEVGAVLYINVSSCAIHECSKVIVCCVLNYTTNLLYILYIIGMWCVVIVYHTIWNTEYLVGFRLW